MNIERNYAVASALWFFLISLYLYLIISKIGGVVKNLQKKSVFNYSFLLHISELKIKRSDDAIIFQLKLPLKLHLLPHSKTKHPIY